ncbi:Hypothetical predicted protein [Olea europaea subsp. europaea]|uniref:Uncharacterized protein n=1 Tax=Olea europaea subsp. europaea TaxID=158383 RepID=A0A8S0QYH3_OLEEU|nr:Hypothetical predicted protein [Olea europaea subsp. europaea]
MMSSSPLEHSSSKINLISLRCRHSCAVALVVVVPLTVAVYDCGVVGSGDFGWKRCSGGSGDGGDSDGVRVVVTVKVVVCDPLF